jgi:hypothetical protein
VAAALAALDQAVAVEHGMDGADGRGLIIGYCRISLSRILGAPHEGCSFFIPSSVRSTWVLDVSPPALGGLTIERQAQLRGRQADLELTTEWIMLHGELEIGTEAKPHTRKATITLTDNVPAKTSWGMGDRGIMIWAAR